MVIGFLLDKWLTFGLSVKDKKQQLFLEVRVVHPAVADVFFVLSKTF